MSTSHTPRRLHLPSLPPDGAYSDVSSGDEAPLPAELTALDNAARDGNLETVDSILRRERLSNSVADYMLPKKCYAIISSALYHCHRLVVECMISHGLDFNLTHVAAAIEFDFYELLPVFLAQGWDINEPEVAKKPPLLARVLDNKEITQWFLANGADPNAQCAFDTTPLSKTVQHHARETIDKLFDHGGTVDRGQLLFHACRRPRPDNTEVAQMLIEKGCKVDTIELSGHKFSYDNLKHMGLGTPLHGAIRRADNPMVELFLSNHANLSIRDSLGRSLIQLARLVNDQIQTREAVQILNAIQSELQLLELLQGSNWKPSKLTPMHLRP